MRMTVGFISSLLLTISLATAPVQAQRPGEGGPPRDGRGQPPGGFGMPPIPFLDALDLDHNRALSKSEIENAAKSLSKLDSDADGALSSQESGWPPVIPGRDGRGAFPFPPPPPIAVIDADRDNVISADELRNAAKALLSLDKDKDGQIGESEMMPEFGGRGPGGPGGRRGGRGGFDSSPAGPRLNPEDLEFRDGVATIPDHATYHELSYRGNEVMIDTFLAGLEFVKFTYDRVDSDNPQLYFINTKTHRGHPMFARAAGLPGGRGGENQMKGVLVYRPMLKSPSGNPGLYTFEFEPFDQFPYEMVRKAYDVLIEKMPILKGNLGYYPRDRGITSYERDKDLYEKGNLPVYLDEDLTNTAIGFLPLNRAESYGLLRLMKHDERPGPRDVVIYRTLPNELSRVAGVMTEVRQTPLSHVNLRAVQDGIPNAFVSNASEHGLIKPLIGQFVRFQVTADGFDIRQASADEVDAYFVDLRPASPQVPKRDLSVKAIRKLDDVAFADASSVGVKAANIAAMRTFRFAEGTIPDGHAIPFYYYDEFMKHNGFYDVVAGLLENEEFRSNRETQEKELKDLRAKIRQGEMPEWMMASLEELHQQYPEGTSLRCRSSTNNEDLPGFSGAGLYDSCTHRPDEGHLSKSVKQIFASMWNFRAFEEREFYRVDHLTGAMGILVHPNFDDEVANGVAVTDDILYQTAGNYYVNTQVGEDLVTNPNEESVPEEILLGWWERDGHQVMRESSHATAGKPLLTDAQLSQLRDMLAEIHARFAKFYGHTTQDKGFAMEIEFKITKDGVLVIKQARPWVYSQQRAAGN